ncbi:MAG: TrmH family RNA methyltransferase [Planctomycetota bacterium]
MISKARLKYLRSLRQRKARSREGALLVEGLNVVEEAVAAGEVRELLLSDEIAQGPRGRALVARGLPVHTLGESDMQALAETRTPAGAFALVTDPCGPFDPAHLPDEALVLLAAGVADPGNLGTLIRTAAALGVAAVVTAAGTVEATNPKVVRATAGALFRIPVRHGEAAALKEAGFELFVADAGGRPFPELADRPARLALAVGNEPRGLPADVVAAADVTVAVPQVGAVESLNVAVATGILLHALRTLPVRRT